MRRALLLLVAVCSFGAAQFSIAPLPAKAAETCSASFVMLGQMPALTGSTPTDWFNVFGEGFDASVPAVLTFGSPVIPYSMQPTVVEPAVTVFTMPAQYMFSGFKWTFRSRDVGIRRINVTIAGNGCQASTIVDTSPTPPPTGTEQPPGGSTAPPFALALAFVGGLLVVRRRLGERR